MATCVLPEGFTRQAGHSYVIDNLLFINEVIKVTKNVPKGEPIISDITVDNESIDANISYGLASKEGLDQQCCRLIGSKIVYSTGDVTPGNIVLVVIASLKQS